MLPIGDDDDDEIDNDEDDDNDEFDNYKSDNDSENDHCESHIAALLSPFFPSPS